MAVFFNMAVTFAISKHFNTSSSSLRPPVTGTFPFKLNCFASVEFQETS